MISFIQKVLQKHHKWLFSILLVIVVVSFVFTVGASPGIGRNSHRNIGKIFNVNFSSQKEMSAVLEEVKLSALLNYTPLFFPQQIEQMLLIRLAQLSIADQIGIPYPDKKSVTAFSEKYPAFLNENSAFDPEKYNQFLDSFTKKEDDSLVILEKTICNDYRISKVKDILGISPFVFKETPESLLKEELTQYSFAVASFDKNKLKESIVISEDDIQRHYDEHGEQYKLPMQYIIKYVVFNKDKFKASIPTPDKKTLKEFYNSHKNLFTAFKEGSPEMKQSIVQEYEKEQSTLLAQQSAEKFLYTLYEQSVLQNSPQIGALLKKYDLEFKEFQPFSVNDVPSDWQVSAENLIAGTQLDTDRYYSEPCEGKDGNIYILFNGSTVPEILPPLSEVQEKVRQDVFNEKLASLFKDKTKEILARFNNDSHMSFDDFKNVAAIMHMDLVTHELEKVSTIFEKYGVNGYEVIKKLSSDKPVYGDVFGNLCNVFYLNKKNIPENIDPNEIDTKWEQLKSVASQRFLSEYLSSIIHAELKKMDLQK